MQFAKDSFLLTLQQRLAGLNPARTVTVNGMTVPAVVAVENLPPSAAEPQPNAFYIEWGTADVVDGHAGNAALMRAPTIDARVSFMNSAGSSSDFPKKPGPLASRRGGEINSARTLDRKRFAGDDVNDGLGDVGGVVADPF